jgi:hypothetical protein
MPSSSTAVKAAHGSFTARGRNAMGNQKTIGFLTASSLESHLGWRNQAMELKTPGSGSMSVMGMFRQLRSATAL